MEAPWFKKQNEVAMTAQAMRWWQELTHKDKVSAFYSHFLAKSYARVSVEDIYTMYVGLKAKLN